MTRMRARLTAVAAMGLGVAGVWVVAAPGPAGATIHPIVASACASPQAEAQVDPQAPPGQTPDEQHSDQSTLRALQATGLLTLSETGEVLGLDVTIPASKWSAPFTPDESFAAFANCTFPAGIPEEP